MSCQNFDVYLATPHRSVYEALESYERATLPALVFIRSFKEKSVQKHGQFLEFGDSFVEILSCNCSTRLFWNYFVDEETGRCIENANWSISIFKRWNPEDNIVAIVCNLEKTCPSEESLLNREVFVELIDYALQKLDQANEKKAGHYLKIFYPTNKNVDSSEYFDYLDDLRNNISLTYTFVPVVSCKDENTYLSICGTRTE